MKRKRRRQRQMLIEDIFDILTEIVKRPGAYIWGFITTLSLLFISEVLLSPRSIEVMGHITEMSYGPFQWFIRFLAVCFFVAALINFIKWD